MTRRLVLILLALALAPVATAQWTGCGDSSSNSSADSTKPTAADATQAKRSAVVWAVGDGADGGADAKRVADLIERGRPDRVLYLGDVYDSGTADEFTHRYDPTFGRFDKIAAPTPGNHDWHNHDTGYDPYWRTANPEIPNNRHYYRFEAGGWEFFSLNSESGLDSGSPQMKWLKQRLRGAKGNCRIAFWHRPFLNAGKHGDQKDVAPLWRALRGRAALVLNGHDHNLQQFKRKNGIVELISGAGGHDLYQSNEKDPRLAWDEDDEYGAVRLDLRPRLARFRFVTVDKSTVHRGRVRCETS